MSSFSAIAIVTRQHFGDGTEGWALALIGDIIVYLWPVWCLWFLLLCSHLYAARAVCARKLDPAFTGDAYGDRLLESLRAGGDDPAYSTATKRSVGVHLAVILGPILLSLIPGCWGRIAINYRAAVVSPQLR